MRVWGAIDLRGGAAVQLVGGRPESERVRVADVDGLLDRWAAAFGAVHVVDLDAALGTGDNSALIERLVSRTSVPLQVGGGLRTTEAVERVLGLGATRVIVGTRALDDRAWLADLAARWPARIVLAADQRAGRVLRRGWAESIDLTVTELLADVAGLPLAAVLVTDVGREGGLGGVDAEGFGVLARASYQPLIAAGGIRDIDDLRALRAAGVAEAVVGMAAYTGAIDPSRLRTEFLEIPTRAEVQ